VYGKHPFFTRALEIGENIWCLGWASRPFRLTKGGKYPWEITLPSGKYVSSLTDALVRAFGSLPATLALVLAGSRTSGSADSRSDVDFYVYADSPPALEERTMIMHQFAACKTG